MKYFPIFLSLSDRPVVIVGGGEIALSKLRVLLRTEACLHVFARSPAAELEALAASGRICLTRRSLCAGDLPGAALVYAATGEDEETASVVRLARAAGVPVNVVDDLGRSDFITPAIVDRDPVTIAIGTEGAAPVLARALKADLEARLPVRLGLLARIGQAFRPLAAHLPQGRRRRDFWAEFYFSAGPRALGRGGAAAAEAVLRSLLSRHMTQKERDGHVAFVGAGPGDPELLTLAARRALDEADVVLHDRLVPPAILDLARREARIVDVGKRGFAAATPQDRINALMVQHAGAGDLVVRLKSGDPSVFGRLEEEIEACEAAGIGWHVVPGITAASAAAAGIGQSLTRRGRNSALRLLTAHDMQGFAEQDWRALARPGAVAAIYMGKRAARFLQGRLMMHGAASETPVTVVENASRPDQRILPGTLATLATTLENGACDAPAMMLLGLAPRAATGALMELKEALS
ncbi:uroporphyrin-III C-methyltransferase/precorrin-2 dehydrogenase/sirohydrochlorin ferrochelatase [Rhodovulum imhoffii]|uniref:Uroporphyrin-III C-methyltransferase/precorrin-2 dehydrogenase/sirohydrochlorin ferrochelatase n=1 Tax=Rhodovulum imhoffii TaxID=365340 RepID=A0A2T5BVL8_9RHOB|nr:siroheme synthase CysG [Rhodovulum imhoffii]MBK5932841.1 uroporphyrinogen-III C-methyltransferase [Rhodovulum imhoffii]PTN03590.1 uroporphyrin-III C-methyltransferase/precorrin-2 dehydrogenase/sirohydrochlorin ferrochelatase [Rhodovulum imhoffii]